VGLAGDELLDRLDHEALWRRAEAALAASAGDPDLVELNAQVARHLDGRGDLLDGVALRHDALLLVRGDRQTRRPTKKARIEARISPPGQESGAERRARRGERARNPLRPSLFRAASQSGDRIHVP
jgi:hypothetical protein